MTEKAAITKPDLRRACMLANETGCGIEISAGAQVWRIVPRDQLEALAGQPGERQSSKLIDKSDAIRM